MKVGAQLIAMAVIEDAVKYITILSQELFTTVVGPAMMLYLLMLFTNAFLISVVLEHFIAPTTQFSGIVAAFTGYSFLIGIGYNKWIQKVNEGRYSQITRYTAIIDTANNMTAELKGLYQSAAEVDESSARDDYMVLRDLVTMTAWYSYRLFYQQDRIHLTLSARGASSTSSEQFGGLEFEEEDFVLYNAKDISARILRDVGGDPVELSSKVLTQMTKVMATLQRRQLVNDVFISNTTTNFHRIVESINSISIQSTIREPRFYSALNGLMTIFWIFVWMPVNLWIPMGSVPMWFLYPALAFVLTGPALYDFVRGNTFDPAAQIKIGKPHMARMIMLRNANEMHLDAA